jgi:hypothetical protein
MNLNFIEYYRNLAINTYDVDPVIFVILVVITTPFYYYSLFVISKIIYKLKTEHKLNNKEILKHKDFIVALIVNQVAWIIPNIYIIFWGENLPVWVWLLVAINIFLTVYLFSSKILTSLKQQYKSLT